MDHNINMERGKQLLKSKIALADVSGNSERNLALLFQYFEPCVGIMALDGLFAAGRIAQACVDVSTLYDAETIEFLSTEVLKRYIQSGGNIQTKILTRSEKPGALNLKPTREATEEEVLQDPTFNEKFEMFTELDNSVKIEGAEQIDVISDIPVEFLDVEGLRSRGLIKIDFNAEVDKIPELVETGLLRVAFIAGEDIRCPACESISIFCGYNDRYECLECQTKFIVDYNEDEEEYDEVAPELLLPPSVLYDKPKN